MKTNAPRLFIIHEENYLDTGEQVGISGGGKRLLDTIPVRPDDPREIVTPDFAKGFLLPHKFDRPFHRSSLRRLAGHVHG